MGPSVLEVLGPQTVLGSQECQRFHGRPQVLLDPKALMVQYYLSLQGLLVDQGFHWLLRVRVAQVDLGVLLVLMVLVVQLVHDLHLVLAVLSLHFDLGSQDYHLARLDHWLQLDLFVQRDP